MQQSRLGRAVGAVVLVLTVTFAAGPDDPPLLVALDVQLALAARQGTGGELLDEAAS